MQIIMNQKEDELYVLENITSLYIGSDGCTIKAAAGNTRGGIIGRYDSYEEAKTAFVMLCEKIEKGLVVIKPPGAEETRERIKAQPKLYTEILREKRLKGMEVHEGEKY